MNSLKFIKENTIELKVSKYIKDKYNKGVFATRDIKKGENVCVYFGDILDEDKLYEKYKNNPYIMKYIRKGNGFLVDASIVNKIDNIKLLGGYVNDISKPKSKSKKDLEYYNKTKFICNIEVVDTDDFPIYRARKDINKGSELFVHYGEKYWLLDMGVKPEDLINMPVHH